MRDREAPEKNDYELSLSVEEPVSSPASSEQTKQKQQTVSMRQWDACRASDKLPTLHVMYRYDGARWTGSSGRWAFAFGDLRLCSGDWAIAEK